MARQVAVLTADVIRSSAYSAADRRRLDIVLRAAFRDAEHRFEGAIHTRMTFRITAGDEFQCVISDAVRAFDVVTYVRAVVAAGGLRPPVQFRAALGVGQLSTPKRATSYEEDGTAFVRSRRGLEDLGNGRNPIRWTKLITGVAAVDRPIDTVLCLSDYMQQSWTVPQWESVRWSVVGLTREAIAKKLHIAHQNVSKRLLAAGWAYFDTGARFVRDALAELSRTRPAVQTNDTP